MNIEQLKKAYDLGATHCRNPGELYKILNDYVYCHDFGGWSPCFNACDIEDWLLELVKIDFSPLNGD